MTLVCAQQDGNFHVFPPDDSSPMSTSLPLAGKVFSSYFADYILSAAAAAEIWNIHQISSNCLTGKIMVGVPHAPKSYKITNYSKIALGASKLLFQIKTFTGMPLFDFCPLLDQKVLGT